MVTDNVIYLLHDLLECSLLKSRPSWGVVFTVYPRSKPVTDLVDLSEGAASDDSYCRAGEAESDGAAV